MIPSNVSLKVASAYGRLYISGPDRQMAASLPGAAENKRTHSWELSLTLESLRRLRKVADVSRERFAQFCTQDVMAWARAAAVSDRVVNTMHERLATGWRVEFEWADKRSGTIAPPNAPEEQTYPDLILKCRRWKYRAPYDHQKIMSTVAMSLDGCAYLCEMGCVDADTEYLSPTGWKQIADYKGGQVGQYHPETRQVEFVEPLNYVKLPCDEMIHFTSDRGVDQMVSPEHRILLVDDNDNTKVVVAEDLEFAVLNNRNAMRRWRLPTTCRYQGNNPGLLLTNEELRVQVAVMADGHFPPSSTKRCTVRLKKPRKIERLRRLLKQAQIEAYERPCLPEGFVAFSFAAPLRTKVYGPEWWTLTSESQRRIVADECVHWDGTKRKAGSVAFYSYVEASADFVQWCLTTSGWCAAKRQYGPEFVVHASERHLKQLGNGSRNVKRVLTSDGFKYCFVVPSTFLVFRRNGQIFPSGNTGKTRSAIEAAKKLVQSGKLDNIIVVCPRGVMGTWEREAAMWGFPSKAIVLIDMPVKERIAAIDKALPHGGIYVVNFDVVKHMVPAVSQLATRQRLGLIVDEMQRIRNPRAQWSEATMQIAQHVKWRLGMSGSPILQGAHDIWSQWYVVDLGITFGANFVQFRREYFDENPYDFSINPKQGTLEKIGTYLRRRGLRYTTDECLDLPPKIMLPPIEVPMSKDQAKAYAEMEEFLIARLEGRSDGSPMIDPETGLPFEDETEKVSSAANQLAMMLRLTQVTSGFLPATDGTIHFFKPNPKMDALIETLEEELHNHQVLIWARYRLDHDRIAERLNKYNPQIFRGKVSQKKRDEIELGFERGEYQIIIGQPAAGGLGLNLQAASQAYYYSQDYNLEFRLQSERRNYRAGSEIHDKITYQDFMCIGTADYDVSAGLAGKKSVADIVVDLKRRLGVAV